MTTSDIDVLATRLGEDDQARRDQDVEPGDGADARLQGVQIDEQDDGGDGDERGHEADHPKGELVQARVIEGYGSRALVGLLEPLDEGVLQEAGDALRQPARESIFLYARLDANQVASRAVGIFCRTPDVEVAATQAIIQAFFVAEEALQVFHV